MQSTVAIAISAYRSDAAVIGLLERIAAEQIPFDWLLVVDSCGSGALREHIAGLLDQRVAYHHSDENLGSAGNLARRYDLAASFGADWMLALNHDARISRDEFDCLRTAAAQPGRIGAVYPLRYEVGRRSFDITGTGRFPWRYRGADAVAADSLVPIYWSSSNGALYSLAPAREGLRPDPTFWLGWEDYAYGLALRTHGWGQYLVERASKKDAYEYRDHRFLGLDVTTADKPIWYCYYSVRNLILTHLHAQFSLRGLACLAVWIPLYAIRLLLFSGQHRRSSMAYFATGLWHGLLNRRGKWRLPA